MKISVTDGKIAGMPLKYAAVILVIVAVVIVKVLWKGPVPVSIEEIERRDGIAVAVEHPVRMDFAENLFCDGEIGSTKRYMLRAGIGEVVEKIHVDRGDIVRKNQLIIEFRRKKAKAVLLAAKVAHEEAARNYNRYKSLHEKGGVAVSAVEAMRTTMASAAAVLEQARSGIGFVEVRAPAGIGDEGSVLVEKRFVDPGEYKGIGDELMSLVDLAVLELRASVPEADVRFAAPGGKIQFLLEGDAVWRDAVIGRVSPTSTGANRFFDVFAGITNVKENGVWRMRPGIYAEVRIPKSISKNALAVNASAVNVGETGSFVFISSPLKGGRNRAQKIDVVTGLRSGGMIQIAGGALKETDLVISNPRRAIHADVLVNIVEGGGE